jgi:hypothetical protein
MRILPAPPARSCSPTFAVGPRPLPIGPVKGHMIFAEELMERMAAEERKPELVRDA